MPESLTDRLRPVPTIDAVVPARNEEPTVASVVEACLGCRFVREVIVVDDGSTDATAAEALAAGAKVVARSPADGGGDGSKAHAMAAGVAASDAEALLFVDADLLGLTSSHLDEICLPYVEGRAAMSIGWFDYGVLNPLVLRLPPTTGERILPRWVFESVPVSRRHGYNIELLINQVVAEARLPTSARIMEGVGHRTKRQKFGYLDGYRRSLQMLAQLAVLVVRGLVRKRSYLHYLRGLTVEGAGRPRPAGGRSP